MTTLPQASGTPWRGRFFSIWIPQQLSLIGSALGQFALVWWVTQSTGSATVLATATVVAMLPGILGGPFIGALVDRWDRQRVMIVADAGVALVSALLAVLFWTGTMRIWHLYLILCLRGIGGTFHGPAMTASTSLMVPKEQLPRVGGLNQVMRGIVRIVSPPLGALLLSLMPLHSIMAIDVVTAAVAIAPLFWIRIPQVSRAETTASAAAAGSFAAGLWDDVREGWRYMTGWKGLFYLAILAMVTNFGITPAVELMPIMVSEYFRGGATQLAWITSAWGVGAVVGGLILSAWGGFRRRIVTVMVGIAGLGVGILVVALTPPQGLALALGGVFFGAVMNSLCNGSISALLQDRVAPEMQGRFFTVLESLCAGMMPLAMLLGGPVADAFGPRVLFFVGAFSQITAALVGLSVPAIMRIEREGLDTATATSSLAEQVAA